MTIRDLEPDVGEMFAGRRHGGSVNLGLFTISPTTSVRDALRAMPRVIVPGPQPQSSTVVASIQIRNEETAMRLKGSCGHEVGSIP